jgi:23S rRNA pseudouridine1911/1915/1917 synthase
VQAGGETITDPAYRVKQGEDFGVTVPTAEDAAPKGQDIALCVVHEDDDVIVVDKPAGLVVHPAPGHRDRTLVNALIAHCGKSLSGIGGVRRPGIVHRLDKDTSGLIVAAKNDAAHASLSAQFAARTIARAYLAVVWGTPSPAAGAIEGNVGRHPGNRKKMAVLARGGKPARTNYRTLQAFATAASVLECRLETGRTHQIRVHLAAKGHPLLGDPVYGGGQASRIRRLPEAARAAPEIIARQALHARLIGFRHPQGGAWLEFASNVPIDIKGLIDSLAAGTGVLLPN